MRREAAISISRILAALFLICLGRNQAAILTHYILDLNVVAAVQLDHGPMNTSQLELLVIGSVLGAKTGVDGFGGVGSGTPSGVSEKSKVSHIVVSGRGAWFGFIYVDGCTGQAVKALNFPETHSLPQPVLLVTASI